MKTFKRLVGILLMTLTTACGLAETKPKKSSVNILQSTQGHFLVIGNTDTWLKISPDQSSDLQRGSEKCALKSDTTVLIHDAPERHGNHFLVNTRELLPECDFTQGYVFALDVAQASSGGSSGGSGKGGNVSAFLDVIAYAEGTKSNYNYSFGYHVFYSYADHPRALYCAGSLCSDAAGRYQFLSTTWDPLSRQAGLADFSPENQDRAAILLLKQIGAYSTVANISNFDDFCEALRLSSSTWASLPWSPYGQPTHSASSLWDVFTANQ